MLEKEGMLNEFYTMIYQANIAKILPFLEKYQQGNKTSLKDALKKAKQYWTEGKDFSNHLDINPHHYLKRCSTQEQDITLSLLSFALLGLNDLNRSWNFIYRCLPYIIENQHYFQVLVTLKPVWLTEYLTKEIREWNNLSYQKIRLLEQYQLICFNPELFAVSIADHSWGKIRDDLLFQRDIPTLFDYETNLFTYWSGQYWQEGQLFWHKAFVELMKEQKLERLFCIRKILEIQTKDWSPQNKKHFREILPLINVSIEELLQLQDSLFLLLHNPNYG